MKHLKSLLFLAALLCFGHAVAQKSKAPDFAYPAQQAEKSYAELQRAVADHNGPATVKSAVWWSLAKAQISTDSLQPVLARLDNLSRTAQEPAARAMLSALMAQIYTQIYLHDQFKIQQRPTMASAGNDYSLWSRRQFVERIDSLVGASLLHSGELKEVPVTDYSDVIAMSRADIPLYPTLYDFISSRDADMLRELIPSGSRTLNVKLLADPDNSSLYPAGDAVQGKILRLYALRAEYLKESGRTEAYINCDLERLRFIQSNVFTPRRDDTQKTYLAALQNRYQEWLPKSEDAVRYLLAIQGDSHEYYQQLVQFSEKYPRYSNINAVKNRIQSLSAPSVTLDFPTLVSLSNPFDVKVTGTNASSVRLDLYDVTSLITGTDSYIRLNKILTRGKQPAQSCALTFSGEFPYSAEQKAQFTLPKYGRYAIIPVVNDSIRPNGSVRVIFCSDLAAASIGSQNPVAVVVNPLTGAPQKDVSIEHQPWSRRQNFTLLKGVTDAEGFMTLDKVITDGQIHPLRGDDRYSPANSVAAWYDRSRDDAMSADLQTALSLYHPGDTVRYSLVAFSLPRDAMKYNIAENAALTVILRDANWQEAGTAKVTTDSWGRAEGFFVLPAQGLQGTYSISAQYRDAKGTLNDVGSTHFTVSDYKLPTFEVKDLQAQRPAALGKPAVISGKALTYAGFPVGDAQVKLSVSERTGFWWWSTATPVFAEIEGRTDAAGNFSITIPADVIAGSPAPNGMVVTDVAVTSADGETSTGTISFNLGKPLTIIPHIPALICKDKAVDTSVEAVDYQSKPQAISMRYEIKGKNSNGEIAPRSGSVESGKDNLTKIISALPVGEYTAVICPADSTLAEPSAPVSFTIWSTKGDISPMAGAPVWTPLTTVTANAASHAEIPLGSSADKANILLYIADEQGNLVSKRWVKAHRGMQTIGVDLPAGSQECTVSLWCVSNYDVYRANVTVKAASSDDAIDFTVETFRDKVTPGQEETLTLRVTPKAGAEAQSAVMLSMTNMAINALSQSSLDVSVPRVWMPGLSFSSWQLDNGYISASESWRRLPSLQYGQPSWEFFGRSYAGDRPMAKYRIRGTKASLTADSGFMEESAMEDASNVMMAAGAAAPQAVEFMAVKNEAKMDTVEEEAVEEAPETGNTSEQNAVYRPSEIPLAFFRPMLLTEPDGTLKVSYRVPDANTTWLLLGTAYNRQLLTSSLSQQIVASKPLMVNVNAPRFLRGGDKVTVRASVMNNTDSAFTASGAIEVVSQSDGKIIASLPFADLEIAPKEQKIVEIPYTADALCPAVIFRARATEGIYTDGEQELVAILPSDQDVMESQMFFLAPDQARFSMELDAMEKGDKAMLNFTENPTWQVVSALPGLRQGKIDSSVEAAHAIFSARVARGIVNRYPEIGRTLRRWAENPGDSVLISELEKNSELKDMLLSATPWVRNAQSDTERMQRLVLLLSTKECDRVVDEALATLGKTHVDGGWSWTTSYPHVSQWATEEVLLTLGMLNRMGWLDADRKLDSMIQSAVKYIDAETVKDYARYPKGDYSLYTFLRTLYPEIKQSTAARKVSTVTVQRCIGSWKNHDVQAKAVDALILSRHGYAATSRSILSSLREYATVTPAKGMWWQQLDHKVFWSMDRVGITALILNAFAEIEPKCADIDKIRQWLILQKQNTDWGSSAVTTMTVASILTSGSKWTVNPRGTAIHIGDKLLEVDDPAYATGEFTADITPYLARNEELTIDRQANYPSFGSVVKMLRRPMAGLKAVPCAELSVEKQLSVFRDGQWVEQDHFNIGDRVKVTLTLRADDDLSYVVVSDPRAAGLQLADQLPAPVYSDGVCFYRENRDSETSLYIDRLNRGTYQLQYELFAAQAGSFTSGAAEAQSQYNPIVVAHSAGGFISVGD